MKSAGVISFLLISQFVAAQVVTVLDRTTQQPLANVAVFAEGYEQTTVTGENGKADISGLQGADAINFQRLGYDLKTYSYEQLEAIEFRVLMTGKAIPLDEMIISASRWEQNDEEIPNQITRIDAEEIAFKNPQTAADLLGETDQVYIQKSQLGGGSPMIRGFATNRVLLVVDGVRMNNAIFRSGNLQNVISLDPHSIAQSEVIFGPGSVIYGSDAIGGVMDFHTLEAKLGSKDELYFAGNASMRYASANNERSGHYNFNIGLEKWAFRTSLSYSGFDDQLMGKHGPDEYLRPSYASMIGNTDVIAVNANPRLQTPTGYDQLNVMQKVRFQPDGHLHFTYGFHHATTSDIPRYDRLIIESNGKLKNAEWYYGPQQWTMHNFRATSSRPTRLYDQARLVAAAQRYIESRHDRDFGSSFIRNRTETVNAYNFNLDFERSLADGKMLFYGAEAVINSVGSEAQRANIFNGERRPASTRYPDGSLWSSYSAYITTKTNLGEKWTLLGGGRYSHVFINAPFDTTHFNFPFDRTKSSTGSVNGSAGVVYRPAEDWQLNLNLSTGFRAPNIDDIGKVFDSEPGNVTVPNPDLRPEYAYNAEAGFEKRFSGMARLSVTGFYSILTDAMLRRDHTFNGRDSIVYDGTLSQVQALQNVGTANVYGLQSSLEINLWRGLIWRSSVSLQRGFESETASGERVPLRHAAPAFGTSHLVFKYARLRLDLYGRFNGAIRYENMAPSERGKPHLYARDQNGNPYAPAWWTLNFKAGFYLNEHFSIMTGMENILNKRYRPYSSGIAAPARNVIISIRGSL